MKTYHYIFPWSIVYPDIFPICFSKASSLLQDLEELNTLIRSPTNMGEKKSRGGERALEKNSLASE